MLDEILKKVSNNCLKGQEVPPVLAALWEKYLKQDKPLTLGQGGGTSLTLLSEISDDFLNGFNDTDDTIVNKAFDKLCEEICFIGKESEGEFVGLWQPSPDIPLSEAIVVKIDLECSFWELGDNLADYIIQTFLDLIEPNSEDYCEKSHQSYQDWCQFFDSKQITYQASPDDIWDGVEDLPSLEERFEACYNDILETLE